jgi:hypothetical protein
VQRSDLGGVERLAVDALRHFLLANQQLFAKVPGVLPEHCRQV